MAVQPDKKKKKGPAKAAPKVPAAAAAADAAPQISKRSRRGLKREIKASIETALGNDKEYQAVQEAMRESRRKVHHARLGVRWRTKGIVQRTRAIEKAKRDLAAFRLTESEHVARLADLQRQEDEIVARIVARVNGVMSPADAT